MRLHFFKSLLLCVLVGTSSMVWSQDFNAIRLNGEEHFRNQNFDAALKAFRLLKKNGIVDAKLQSKIGICHYELGKLSEAQSRLHASIQSADTPPEAFRYLAKVYHERFQFEEAIIYYKDYLKATGNDAPFRASVKDDLLRCGNGIHVRRQESKAAVVNLGAPLNSDEDEFAPVLHPTINGRLYFAKSEPEEKGQKTDLYFSNLKYGDWTSPEPVSIFLNSTQYEIPVAIDEQGKRIYFFRGNTNFSGDILWDTLRENNLNGTLFLQSFEGPVKTWEADRDVFFFNDSILLFSSRRPGGYGGFDLYVATLQSDGWSAPENLGPTINSAYDEVSPFLASDGRTLYFSTNDARKSIGGMDIMRSYFLDRSQKWIPPVNLGVGFNSAGDDTHLSLSNDGSRAFFSSNRKQGLGKRDLYVGIFESAQTEQLQRSEPVAFHFVEPQEEIVDEKRVPPPSEETQSGFELLPLKYLEPNMPFTESSFEQLDELANWIKNTPELKITFVAHTALGDSWNVAESALQQVKESLERQNVPLDNVMFRNGGSVFTLQNGESPLNRRVDIVLTNEEVLPIEIIQSELRRSRAAFFQKAMSRLIYQVKIKINEDAPFEILIQKYPDGNLLSNPVSEENTFVRGIYLTWNSALQACQEMRASGFPQATVVPFYKGWELSKDEAQNMTDTFPELSDFTGQ